MNCFLYDRHLRHESSVKLHVCVYVEVILSHPLTFGVHKKVIHTLTNMHISASGFSKYV